jgi:dephospho-CoA kinase
MASEVPPDRPRTVLLGGGIGAGKSAIADLFARRGFDIVIADRIGADVLATGAPAVAVVARRWPDVVHDGVVDRAALASIVFHDPDELAALEAITHPAIADVIEDRIESAGGGPILIEVPVRAVVGDVDALRIAVIADEDVRIARAVARGGDRDDVVARVRSQGDESEWRDWADLVVDNTGSWSETERTVEAIIEEVVGA